MHSNKHDGIKELTRRNRIEAFFMASLVTEEGEGAVADGSIRWELSIKEADFFMKLEIF